VGGLFGTDGIRGEAYRYPMDAETAFMVGQALTRVLGAGHRGAEVLIGKDTRVSGDMLESALDAGVRSVGGTTRLAGVLPTPGIAFLAADSGADAGVVISASHNPYQDNGIKIFSGKGFKLTDEQQESIEAIVSDGGPREAEPPSSPKPAARRLDDAADRYRVFLQSTFPRDLSTQGLRVVLDTANGATYQVAPMVFAGLGIELMVIHDAPDGMNINKDCGSEHTEDLALAVVENGAALGLAFDGDGDRLIAVDEKGTRLSGDQVLIICALMLKEAGRLKNDLLVSTVMSNMGLSAACRRYGLINHAARVGDRYVLEDMLRLGAVLGGEESGHMIFLEHHTTGDGILAGLQLVAAALRAGKPLSELAALMDVFPQKLINVEVKSKPDIESVPEIAGAIKRVESHLGAQGRVLVRYSGTQNMCRVMIEGPTEEITEKYALELADVVRAAIG
jgi:phosphoglucosamine mutase